MNNFKLKTLPVVVRFNCVLLSFWFLISFFNKKGFLFEHKGKESNEHSVSQYEVIINGKQGYILWGIVFVLVAYLGCVGNVVVIVVMKKYSNTTLTILLIALAVSDILAPQANALLGFSFYHLSSKYGNSVAFLKFENILRYIIHPLSTMFTMSSSWIVTITTLFRLIAVKYPFHARTLIDKRKAVFSLLFIFGFSLASITPLYYNLLLIKKFTPDQKHLYVVFEMKEFSELMKKTYTPFVQIMCFYLPWTLSLSFGIILIRSLKNSSKRFGPSSESSQFSISMTKNNQNQMRQDSSYEIHRSNSMSESRMNNIHVRRRSSSNVTLMVSQTKIIFLI